MMYRINFRILVNRIAGANLYVNGSVVSHTPYSVKQKIYVCLKGAVRRIEETEPSCAEVLQSFPTLNYVDNKWEFVSYE